MASAGRVAETGRTALRDDRARDPFGLRRHTAADQPGRAEAGNSERKVWQGVILIARLGSLPRLGFDGHSHHLRSFAGFRRALGWRNLAGRDFAGRFANVRDHQRTVMPHVGILLPAVRAGDRFNVFRAKRVNAGFTRRDRERAGRVGFAVDLALSGRFTLHLRVGKRFPFPEHTDGELAVGQLRHQLERQLLIGRRLATDVCRGRVHPAVVNEQARLAAAAEQTVVVVQAERLGRRGSPRESRRSIPCRSRF